MKINRLRLLRIDKGLTQKYLADKIGVAVNKVSLLETGVRKINEEKLRVIADEVGYAGNPLHLLEDVSLIEP